MALISSPPYFQPSHLDSISAQRLNLRQKIQKKQGKPCYSEYLDQHTTTKNKITSSGEPCSFPHCNALMVEKAVTNVLFSFNLKKHRWVLVDFGASCSPNLLLEDIFANMWV